MALTINSILLKKLFTYRLWINQWESPDESSLHYHKQPKGTIYRFLHLKAKKQPPRPFRTKIFKTLSPYVDISNDAVPAQFLNPLVCFNLNHSKILVELEVAKLANFCTPGKAGVL